VRKLCLSRLRKLSPSFRTTDSSVRIKSLILLAIIVCAVVAAFVIIRPAPVLKVNTVGSKAADFDLAGINNNTMKLSDMRGSVVLVNFWATWCASCVEEMPALERLAEVLSGNPHFKIVTIIYRDDLERASQYLKQNGYIFPVYVNPDGNAPRLFGITGVPETFIIDKKGVLRDRIIGPADWDSPQAVSSLQALINEDP
jgi:cytochrome c biogenesis protein CcmG/thiol:disulfide interchange protein DsbE